MKTVILGLCLFGALFWSTQSMPVGDVVPPAVPSDTTIDSQKSLISKSENVAEIPASEANSKSDVKPEAETKPAADAKLASAEAEAKPSVAKSESEPKPATEVKSEIAKSDLKTQTELVQPSNAPNGEKEIKIEKITSADAVEGPRSDLETLPAAETKPINEAKAEPETIKPNNEIPVALPLNPTEAKDTKSATSTADIKQEEKATAAILADPVPAAATAPIVPVAEEPKPSESIPLSDTKVADQPAKLLETESVKSVEDTVLAASEVSETKVNPSVPAADAPASSEIEQNKQPSPAASTESEAKPAENSPKSESIQSADIQKEEKKPIEEIKPSEQQRSEPQTEATKPAEQPKSEIQPEAAKPADLPKSEIQPEAIKPNEEKKPETVSSEEKKEHSVNKRDALKEKKLTETYKKEDKKQKQKKAN